MCWSYSAVNDSRCKLLLVSVCVINECVYYHPNGAGNSTELAALELTDIIITALDNHNTPLNIFLDLSKAFDTLDHTI